MKETTLSWMNAVQPGDELYPVPLWNFTSKQHRKLPTPTRIMEVRRGHRCQSGIYYVVRTVGGEVLDLDAGWFLPPGTSTPQ